MIRRRFSVSRLPSLVSIPCILALFLLLPLHAQPHRIGTWSVPDSLAPTPGWSDGVASPDGMLLTCDRVGMRVFLWDGQGRIVRVTSGGLVAGDRLLEPVAAAFGGLDLYVADRGRNVVVRFNRRLEKIALLHPPDEETPFAFGNLVDLEFGNQSELWLVTSETPGVLRFDARFRPDLMLGRKPGAGNLRDPRRIQVVGDTLWVLDGGKRLVALDRFDRFLMGYDLPDPPIRCFRVVGKRIWIASAKGMVSLIEMGDSAWGTSGITSPQPISFMAIEGDTLILGGEDSPELQLWWIGR